MLKDASKFVKDIDRSGGDLTYCIAQLRKLNLDQFGELLLTLPDPTLPHLSSLLPQRTPDKIQQEWTGSSGDTLLRQSCSFLNMVAAEFTQATGRSLAGAKVLDFGCGWGRLMRLLPFFTDPVNIYGSDAWDVSLKYARDAKILGTLAKSDDLPTSLPFYEVNFDLIYAFSVFTHLSEAAARACLAAMRHSIAPNGLVIISVRPEEFWDFEARNKQADYSHLRKQHEMSGFAFLPSATNANYGDTSVSRAYLADIAAGWEIMRMGSTLIDPYQNFVILRPS